MTKGEELLPCPFCGAPAHSTDADHGSWRIECGADCDARPSVQLPRPDAIATWNRRTLSSAQERIAELEGALEFAESELDEAANKLWAISHLAHRMAGSRNTVAAARRARTTEKMDG